jgi:hypothetical protein
MSVKTKERCGKLGKEAGMLLKTKEIASKSGNVIENKGLSLKLGVAPAATSTLANQTLDF